MRTHCLCFAAAMLMLGASLAGAADIYGLEAGKPDLQSADVLAFGPDGILFIGDTRSAAVFAVQTGDKSGNPADVNLNIDGLNIKIAQTLGTSSQDLKINDLAVNPATGNVFVAVSTGDRPAVARAAIVKIDREGTISQLSLENIPYSKASLPDAPPEGKVRVGGRERELRPDAITDLAFVDGQVIVTGMSNADAPSTVRSFAFPFAAVDAGANLEIYHGAHGRTEDYAAPRTFVPFVINGEPNLLAGFVCTPLVRFPLSEIQSGAKVQGTTVAELGNMNRPLDMIVYEQDGRTYLLLTNSARGTMKISTERIEQNAGITEPVRGGGTAGQPYETIESLAGAVQLDKLNDTHAVVLLQNESGALDLRTVELP